MVAFGLAIRSPVGSPLAASRPGVANHLRRRKCRGIPGVADSPKGSPIEKCAVVQMQYEDRRVRGDRIDLIERRQALFDKLMLGKPSDDPNPLRHRRAVHLFLEHAHGIGERTHAVPAQFHIVAQAAADDVGMAVDQTGYDAPAPQLDLLRLRSGKWTDLAVGSHGDDPAILDRSRLRLRPGTIKRCHPAIEKEDIGFGTHGLT